ncbi:hypothetical protein H5410_062299 [Solanum commersonii]|uniref:Uncharacterized protein n=1 Tax=Solanum commersonii TaxID=4109 RepID=A0A9J5WAG8_SOLCO|nr:hypothetical protein H5410_062299 [Solanum commersonii]
MESIAVGDSAGAVREGEKKMVRVCDEDGAWWGRSYLWSRRQEERQ